MSGLILSVINPMQKIFISRSEQQTAALAEQFASVAQKGDVFALYGTLGMGKSVFARAFISFLTGIGEIPSPTFTLVQGYTAPEFEINHFDLYRLKYPDEVYELGFEDAVYGGVSLIEWPEKAGLLLPRDIFKIEFMPEKDARRIIITVNSAEKAGRLEQIK